MKGNTPVVVCYYFLFIFNKILGSKCGRKQTKKGKGNKQTEVNFIQRVNKIIKNILVQLSVYHNLKGINR